MNSLLFVFTLCIDFLNAFSVVVEEAAEILESHVLTSLSAKCQHLIMIGKKIRLSLLAYVP